MFDSYYMSTIISLNAHSSRKVDTIYPHFAYEETKAPEVKQYVEVT